MSQTGNVSFHKLNLQSGHFAVSAQHAGMHYVCVKSNAPCMATLNLRTALEVDDHSTVAKKEHVEAIEAELDRMKKLAVHVYECARTERSFVCIDNGNSDTTLALSCYGCLQ